MDEKPERSSSAMKPGSVQTENVSGGAKLSSTRFQRQVGGQGKGAGRVGQMAGGHGARLVKHPGATGEPRRDCLDALDRPVDGIEPENADVAGVEFVAFHCDRQRVEHRHALRVEAVVRLAQPELPAVQRERTAAALEIRIFQRFGAGAHHGRHRRDAGGRDGAEQDRAECRCKQELPGRNPGRTGHHQFRGSSEPPEGDDRPEQHRKRQDLHADPGQP